MSITDLNHLQKVDPMLKNIDFKLKGLQLYNKKIKKIVCNSANENICAPEIMQKVSKNNKFAYTPSKLDQNNLTNSNHQKIMYIISKRETEDLLCPRKCGIPLRS